MTSIEALNKELERLHKLAINSIDYDFQYAINEIKRITNVLIELARKDTSSQSANKK